MGKARRVLLVVAGLMAMAAVVLGQGGGMEEWLARVASPDGNVRQAAWLEAAKYGAPAIVPLGQLLAGEDKSVARAARLAMEVIVADAGKPGNEAKRAATSRALGEALKTQPPVTARQTEIRMLALVGGDEAAPLLGSLLADKDVGEDARQALARIPGPAATQALIEGLSHAAPERQVGFINALARRGANAIVPTLIELSSDANPDVRRAALAALGQLGDPRGLPVALTAQNATDGADRAAAADAVLDFAEAHLVAGDKAGARRLYERVLRTDLPTGRRVAALNGIKQLGDPASLPAVLQSLGDPNPVFHGLAMSLIDQFAGKNVVAVMRDAARTAPPAGRAGLMLGLASRNDGTVAATLREALSDPSDEVKAAAATGLGMVGDQTAAPALLTLAETGHDLAKAAALNSYLKLLGVRLAADKDPALLPAYNHALELATGAPERNLALAGVAAFGDASSLTLVEPLTTADATRSAALRAYVAIGKTLAGQDRREDAKTILSNAIARGAPRDIAGDAAAQLRALGVNIDIAKDSGFATNWWLVGTFPNPNQGGFDAVYPPEKEADPSWPVSFEGKDLAWKPIHTDDVQGIVDLVPQFDPHDNVVAYAYTEVTVPTDQGVTLKIGSDDAVRLWINDQLVHANNAYRPLTVDEDKAQAHLNTGTNRVLVKVVQGGGQWSFCLRMVGRDGTPVKFEQKELK